MPNVQNISGRTRRFGQNGRVCRGQEDAYAISMQTDTPHLSPIWLQRSDQGIMCTNTMGTWDDGTALVTHPSKLEGWRIHPAGPLDEQLELSDAALSDRRDTD